MATEFKCDYCNATLHKNATLVHTERYHGLWDLDCSMCPDCFKQFKVMLEKVKSQKSWTWWAALEQEVDSLKKEKESLTTELQFLRHEDPICDRLMTIDPHNELVTVATKGCDPIKAHRSILISRSDVFKTVLTSEEFKKQIRNHNEPHIKLTLPMHPASFRAFIQFLYTAELKPEVLKDHAPELMTAGNTYDIQILRRKCEDYIVKHMTPENIITNLEVATQCGGSTVITAAAVKQIQSNPKDFVLREDYQALLMDKPAALAGAFQYIILDHPSGKKKEKKTSVAKGSDPGLDPGSDPTINSGLPQYRYAVESSFRSLGTCTCAVHPFAHSAAPGFEYHGVHFHTATGVPSKVNYVDPPTLATPDKRDN